MSEEFKAVAVGNADQFAKVAAYLERLEAMALTRAHELAATCGCRNWRYHLGVARAQIEAALEGKK